MSSKLTESVAAESSSVAPAAVKIAAPISKAFQAALAGSALPGEGDDLDAKMLAIAGDFAARASLERGTGKPSLLLEPMAGDGPDRRMQLVVVNDDMPFLVDSTSQIVSSQGLAIHRILHPVVSVERDAKGRLTGVDAGKAGSRRESVIYMELERGDARARRRLLDALEASLADVRAAVADWKAMRAAMLADAAIRADGEAAELLRWFEGGAMTQLGHEWRTRDGAVHDALGVSTSSAARIAFQSATAARTSASEPSSASSRRRRARASPRSISI